MLWKLYVRYMVQRFCSRVLRKAVTAQSEKYLVLLINDCKHISVSLVKVYYQRIIMCDLIILSILTCDIKITLRLKNLIIWVWVSGSVGRE